MPDLQIRKNNRIYNMERMLILQDDTSRFEDSSMFEDSFGQNGAPSPPMPDEK